MTGDPEPSAARSAGYSGTPLAKKLLIKPGTVVALVGAPEGFEATLGELPPGAALRRGRRGKPQQALWFVRTRRELERDMERMAAFVPNGLWIAWPKGSSGVATDVHREAVREAGLAAGMVDHKVCAIDDTWSGLRFVRRS